MRKDTETRRIPQQLAELRAWCGWALDETGGKPRKIPRHPDGRPFSTRTDRPYTLDELYAGGFDSAETGRSGVGLVLTGRLEIDGATLVAFDLDACRDPVTGAVTEWATELLTNHKQSYAEVTPSGQGLRVLVLVHEPPDTELRKIRTVTPAENTTKRAEIETFGLGRACYVTLTGNPVLNSTGELEFVRNLDWIVNRYPHLDLAPADSPLPTGTGAAPTLSEIDAAVRAHPEGRKLASGAWEDVVPEESASEGYWRLAQRAVRAARGHGDLAVEYLLFWTAYGEGRIDSAEPDRYRSRAWVSKEVARIAGKAPRSPANVFDGGSSWTSTYMPTIEEAARRKDTTKTLALPEEHAAGKLLQVDDFIEEVSSRDWLVDELFPTDGLASVFGKPGQGKTPFVLRLAVATAAGLPEFFGRPMDYHGPVVYFVGEDEAGVRDRVLAQLNEIDPLLVGSGLPLYFTREPGRISDPDNVVEWLGAIKTATGGELPRLVVVDTLARNFGLGNESATEDMQAFVSGCDALSRALGGALVVCTHHPSKGNEEAGRGSGVLLGALDSEIKVELVGRTKLVATPTKIKGGPLPEEPLVGTLVPVKKGLGEKRCGSPRSAITLDDTPPDPAAVFDDVTTDDELLAVLEAVVAADGKPTSRAELRAAAGVTDKTLRVKIAQLEDLGAVEIKPGPSRTSKSTYLVTQQGSYIETRSLALNKGQAAWPLLEGPSKGQEGQDSPNPRDTNE